MERIGILLLRTDGAFDLALSVKFALQDSRVFDCEFMEELLPDERLADLRWIPSGANSQRQPDIVALCLAPGRPTRMNVVLGLLRKHLPGVPIIVATETGDPTELCQLLEQGAADCLTPPFRSMDLLPRVWRLCHQRSQDESVILKLKERIGLKQLVGESPAWLAEIQKIPAVAQCDASVFLVGETGTGKEMVARAIHHLSPRSAKPFIAVNCGGMPLDLVENELFGHEAGAFTGANLSAVGLVQKADGGSLFLDEIDCLPLLAQAKLLRFLQEKEIRPVGANKTCRVDVRVIAASNANLEDAVREGRLRRDLFFRLSVLVMALPPLRERKGDISVLAHHFVAKYASASKTRVWDVSATALQKLELHTWPGNVRELENVIERSVILCPHGVLGPQDIQLDNPVRNEEAGPFRTRKAKVIAQFECAYLRDLLREHRGNISRAAAAAGKNRRAFWALMRKHQITVQPHNA